VGRNYRIPVVAGLIYQDGKLLICQRKAGMRHGLKWEFPGGKVEQGETPRAALARELKEELGIEARIGREVSRYEFIYPRGATLLLIFLEVKDFDGDIFPVVFETVKWEDRKNLPKYDFLDGDMDIVKRLSNGELWC